MRVQDLIALLAEFQQQLDTDTVPGVQGPIALPHRYHCVSHSPNLTGFAAKLWKVSLLHKHCQFAQRPGMVALAMLWAVAVLEAHDEVGEGPEVLQWCGCHVNETEKSEDAAEQVLRIPQIFVVHIIGEHRDAGHGDERRAFGGHLVCCGSNGSCVRFPTAMFSRARKAS